MLPFMNVRTTVLVRSVIMQLVPSYVHKLYVRILWNFLIRPWPVFYVCPTLRMMFGSLDEATLLNLKVITSYC